MPELFPGSTVPCRTFGHFRCIRRKVAQVKTTALFLRRRHRRRTQMQEMPQKPADAYAHCGTDHNRRELRPHRWLLGDGVLRQRGDAPGERLFGEPPEVPLDGPARPSAGGHKGACRLLRCGAAGISMPAWPLNGHAAATAAVRRALRFFATAASRTCRTGAGAAVRAVQDVRAAR